ncbi:hypothetical protein CI109_104158 [Kwoniella shandongensis]|uniref:Uncharacterized protein n=1 Tax=Kwoniella shandongensis TaxID=1734106 RepID=A0A5M6C232_9TREE|nr:uncharacterized protein CI109_002929 [Kwoniella shandongensis]KAA5528771.1 hypothetical protein CI109_002929 [Kwoniella shandongensis]
MLPIASTSSLLLTGLTLLSSVSVSAHRNLPRHARPHPRAHLDERLLPITATTTVVVQMTATATHTVWVQPTNQIPWGGGGDSGGNGESGGNGGQSSSVTTTDAPSASATSSYGEESSGSETASSSLPTSILSEPGDAGPSLSLDSSSIASSTYSSDDITSALTSSYTSDSSAYPTSSPELSSSAIPTTSITDSSTLSASASESSVTATESVTESITASSSGYESESTSESVSASTSLSSSSASASESASASATPSASASASDSASATEESSSLSSSSAITDPATASSTSASASASESISPSASLSAETASITASETASSTTSDSASSTVTSDFASSTSTSLTATESSSAAWNISSITASATTSEEITSTVSSTSASASASSSGDLQPLGSTLMNAYYPDWSGYYLAPESVDWSRFDVVDFAFALPTADYGLEFTQYDSASLLTRLVSTAHAAGKRVKLSIGGWTGSAYFSPICASSSNRKTFIKNILAAYNLYNLDGIDIDWEYPGTGGADGNAVSGDDSANFLKFLTELRAALPDGALITTATQVWPFADSNGRPMTDVSGFAKVIDWILIMNYDVWGSSNTPGANAPLSDGCNNSTQPLANAYASVASWTNAGMPANQITLGVPAYGYLQKSTASQLKNRRRSFPMLPHKAANVTASPRANYVTVYNDNGGSSDGQVMFESLISQGALVYQDGEYVGGNGFTREWDSCSSTPWLKSSKSGQIVTYDDPASMSLKGQFAAQAGLRGCNVFSIDGDWTGSSWPLTDAVRSGLGI